MALKKTITKNIYEQDIVLQNAYLRIGQLEGTKDKISFTVITLTGDLTNTIEIKQYEITPSILDDSPNFIKQGYEYLKTLDEYKDAIDC